MCKVSSSKKHYYNALKREGSLNCINTVHCRVINTEAAWLSGNYHARLSISGYGFESYPRQKCLSCARSEIQSVKWEIAPAFRLKRNPTYYTQAVHTCASHMPTSPHHTPVTSWTMYAVYGTLWEAATNHRNYLGWNYSNSYSTRSGIIAHIFTLLPALCESNKRDCRRIHPSGFYNSYNSVIH